MNKHRLCLTCLLLLFVCSSCSVLPPEENSSVPSISSTPSSESSPSSGNASSQASSGESSSQSTNPLNMIFSFEAVDLDGNPVTNDIVRDAKVIMLNLWEPWCGPCIREMPDLENLYQKYKEQGLVIVGIYSTFSQREEAQSLVEEMKITYPILEMNDQFAVFIQSYVPATYFLGGDRKLLNNYVYSGSRDYETWESIILSYLND